MGVHNEMPKQKYEIGDTVYCRRGDNGELAICLIMESHVLHTHCSLEYIYQLQMVDEKNSITTKKENQLISIDFDEVMEHLKTI